MADLRRIVTSLGHTDVATCIQSGNAVFTGVGDDTVIMATEIESRLATELSVRPGVVVLTRDEFERAVTVNPPTDVADPKRLHAVFRMAEFTADEITAITQMQGDGPGTEQPDEAVVVERTPYLHTPAGFGHSDLVTRLTRQKATWPATARRATGRP